jgi:hypothetical protein
MAMTNNRTTALPVCLCLTSAEATNTLIAGGSAQKVLRRYRTIIRANERRFDVERIRP